MRTAAASRSRAHLSLKPRVLFLDEPTAGMNPTETAEMLEIIRTLKGRFTILLIEHKLDLVMQLSDRVVVMDDGARIAEGLAARGRRRSRRDRRLSRLARGRARARAAEAAP